MLSTVSMVTAREDAPGRNHSAVHRFDVKNSGLA
jgi:hypothetical protein